MLANPLTAPNTNKEPFYGKSASKYIIASQHRSIHPYTSLTTLTICKKLKKNSLSSLHPLVEMPGQKSSFEGHLAISPSPSSGRSGCSKWDVMGGKIPIYPNIVLNWDIHYIHTGTVWEWVMPPMASSCSLVPFSTSDLHRVLSQTSS